MNTKQIFLLTLLSLTCVQQAPAMNRKQPEPLDLIEAAQKG